MSKLNLESIPEDTRKQRVTLIPHPGWKKSTDALILTLYSMLLPAKAP